ncbi:MAG: TlpA family protein disulfide reductase, partial [Acidimicrobiia bacterium]|nr:TlpA family protein disulfide reductase [Acidimicrobiia bacterium]
GDVCIPLPADAVNDGVVDVQALAERAGMPLVHDEAHGLWALGPAGGADRRALTTAQAPELELPDLRTGEMFRLSSLKGQKVLLLAWASW